MKRCLKEISNNTTQQTERPPQQTEMFHPHMIEKCRQVFKDIETRDQMIKEEIQWQYACLEKKLGKTPTEEDVREAHKKGEMIDVFRFLRIGLFDKKFNNIPRSLKLPLNRRTEWQDKSKTS